MGAKIQCENYFPVQFQNNYTKPDARIKGNLLEAWPDYTGEVILKENRLCSTVNKGTMGQCSEKDMEVVKLTMLKQDKMFREQVRELHRIYQTQKLLMAELKSKDSNTSTLTCGPVQDGPFPTSLGSEPLTSEGKNNFWHALSSFTANKDSRDCTQPVSGVDYLHDHSPSLLEKNLQMRLIPQDSKQTPKNFYNLQPSRTRKRTFDLEQPADEYVDDETINKEEEANTLKRAPKDIITEPISLNEQSISESESEVKLTLKTGCEMGIRENGKQTETCVQLRMPEICKEEVKGFKPLGYPEEALLFPTASARSQSLTQETTGKQRPVSSNQSFSRGPFSFGQEYKKSGEWPSASALFQDQRECVYPWLKGVFPGTGPQQINTTFSPVSTKGFTIDPSSTTTTSSLLGVSAGIMTNFNRELCATGLWRKAEDKFLCGVQSQEYCIPSSKTNPQTPNFDLQVKYHLQPFLTAGCNKMNAKQKASEFDMGTWHQNGNLVQHTLKDTQSVCHVGAPSIFGQPLCQSGPIVESKTSQQPGVFHAVSTSAPSSLAFPSQSLQECQRSLWLTSSIGLSAPKNLEVQSDVEGKMEKEVDLTLGLSNGVMDESRKDAQHSSAMKGMEGAFNNNNKKFEATNRYIHQESLHMNGDVQKGQSITRSFIELPYGKVTEGASVKHVLLDNRLDFSDNMKSSCKNMLYNTGDGIISTKHLKNSIGEIGVSQSKENISLVSDLLKAHDITSGKRVVKSESLRTVETGLKSENIPGLVEKATNISTSVCEIMGNNREVRTGKNNADRHLYSATDRHEMKIETFKENINVAYGTNNEEIVMDNREQTFGTENRSLPLANGHLNEHLDEGTCLVLGHGAHRDNVKAPRQVDMKDRLAKKNCTEDGHVKEIDCIEPSSVTYKANVQLSEHEADLQNSQYVDLQRSSGTKIEPDVGTFQSNTTENPSCNSPFSDIERIENNGSMDLLVSTDAANILLKVASEKSSDRSDTDSCKLPVTSGLKESLDWFADVIVSNIDVLESTSTGHRLEAENPLPSTRSGSKTKESEVSEGSVPKEHGCSPHGSNGLDFFESMTLMLEEINMDADCKSFAKDEKEAEKPPSPMNAILRPSKRGKRRRDFQREMLPSISSLSRQEITEDMQIIGGLIRSTGDAWHTGCTRRSSGKFFTRDDWHVPQTGRRSRCMGGSRAKVGGMKKNIEIKTAKQCDLELERFNTLSWTSSWGDTIRRRRMHRPRASMTSLALPSV